MRRFAMILCATLITGFGASGGAVPLSSRPSGPGAHLFGYFDSNHASVGAQNAQCAANYAANNNDPNSAPCQALLSNLGTHANVVNIVGDLAWTQARLAAAQAAGMGAVVSVYGLFYGAVAAWGDPISMYGNALQTWQSWVPMLQPYVTSGTIVAFQIGEEPSVKAAAFRQTFGVLTQIATWTKATFPNVPVMIDLVAEDMDQAGYSNLNPNGFTIPSIIDWVGYDCYTATSAATFTNCYAGTANGLPAHSVPFYLGRLKTIMRAGGTLNGHGIVFFADGWAESAATASDQSALLQRVEREAALVDNDPSIVMIEPFLWDAGGPNGPGGTGVVSMPTVESYYTAWGLHTTTGSQRRAYPTAISSNYPGTGVIYGFDYDTSTAWNSEQFDTAGPYIMGTFLDPIRLTEVDLYVDQSPAGGAVHAITGATLPNNTQFTLADISGSFEQDEFLPLRFSSVVTDQVMIQTLSSPSWVGWLDIQPWAAGSNRVYAYPMATSTPGVTSAEGISDADVNSPWNAGAVAPAWIDLDLGQQQTISLIQLVVDQSPAGNTDHIIYGGPSPAPTTKLAEATGWTQDGQTISISGPFPNVRYLRIYTVNSAGSWVAWREVNVFN